MVEGDSLENCSALKAPRVRTPSPPRQQKNPGRVLQISREESRRAKPAGPHAIRGTLGGFLEPPAKRSAGQSPPVLTRIDKEPWEGSLNLPRRVPSGEARRDSREGVAEMRQSKDLRSVAISSSTKHLWRGGREAEGGGLLNRYTGLNLYREFESPPLRNP